MKTLITSFFTAGLLLVGNSTIGSDTYVYVCTGSSATRYHLAKDCRGLSYCSKEVVKITLSDAKKKGRTLCGWED